MFLWATLSLLSFVSWGKLKLSTVLSDHSFWTVCCASLQWLSKKLIWIVLWFSMIREVFGILLFNDWV
jgi:hypothetical protein